MNKIVSKILLPSLSLSLSLILLLLGCSNPAGSGPSWPKETTRYAVSSHYIIFFYEDADGADYRFVVLERNAPAPADYAAIGAYDGSITLKAKPQKRAGLIFLPGTPALDSDGVPTATLAASTTYTLYAAKDGGEVKALPLKPEPAAPNRPFESE